MKSIRLLVIAAALAAAIPAHATVNPSTIAGLCAMGPDWYKAQGYPVGNGTPAMRALIKMRFPTWSYCNFANSAGINATVASMSDQDLSRLSFLYEREVGYATNVQHVAPSAGFANTADMYRVMAQRLTVANLIRMRAAWGDDLDAAVSTYAPYAVWTAYATAIHKQPIPASRAMARASGVGVSTASGAIVASGAVVASPSLDYTLYEIYLDYRTTGMTASAAFGSAARYASPALTAAFTAGYAIGTGIYWAIDNYAPSVEFWIGDELGNFVHYVCNGKICKPDGVGGE
jgi:hypothetical protein